MKHSHRKEVRDTSFETSMLVQDALALRSRESRDTRRQFLIEGVRAVNLAMEFDALETLFFCPVPGEDGTRFLAAEARQQGIRCLRVEEPDIRAMAQTEDAQNVIGIARQQWKTPEDAFAQEGIWLALEQVRNDGNLGSMLRTAEAAGAQGIIACGPEVDFWAPKSVRAAMGALFSQTLVRASWKDLLAFKTESNARWIGTCLENARPYDSLNYGKNFWLWMGDERKGLSERALEACDDLAYIPMSGRVDSLNVGVAAAVVLFGARLRR
ncbi:RNA methyltransferase [bacterium]|nr:MAG: RNA methyltransferase [bacterium]